MTRAQTIELKTAPEIDAIIAAAAPGYRKKTATLAPFSGTMTVNSYWDSGSKSSYALVDLATRRARPLGGSSHPFFDVRARGHANQTTPDGTLTTDAAGTITLHRIPDGYALVQTGYWRGRPTRANVYVNAANLTPLLPAADPAITETMTHVLGYTDALKNSYGGRTDLRFEAAARDLDMTRDEWTAAQARLVTLKYLRTNGAITPAGQAQLSLTDTGRHLYS